MAFTFMSNGLDMTGNKRSETGTFTNTGTGGSIKTALTKCTYAEASGASVLTFSDGSLSVTTSNASGFWKVEGYF